MASVYTRSQLDQFLGHVDIPSKYRLENEPARDLAYLTCLHTHMLSTVPYENLSLHYSKSHTISLDPQHVFQKIVGDKRGRGGYCMENSLFYNQILRSLGFHVYTVGVRIRHRIDGVPQGPYIGWVHIVNIVTLEDGSRWMIDVGFGGDGASKPIPLVEGHVTKNIGTQEIRLARDFIPSQTERSPERKLWIYQYRNSIDRPWNSFFAFSELVEFLPADYHIMNDKWYTGSHPESFQTFTTLIVMFLRRPKEDAPGGVEIYGKRMLVNGMVKENLGGRTTVVQECRTEAERILALKTWFGISLCDEEIDSIRGWHTELKATELTDAQPEWAPSKHKMS